MWRMHVLVALVGLGLVPAADAAESRFYRTQGTGTFETCRGPELRDCFSERVRVPEWIDTTLEPWRGLTHYQNGSATICTFKGQGHKLTIPCEPLKQLPPGISGSTQRFFSETALTSLQNLATATVAFETCADAIREDPGSALRWAEAAAAVSGIVARWGRDLSAAGQNERSFLAYEAARRTLREDAEFRARLLAGPGCGPERLAEAEDYVRKAQAHDFFPRRLPER